MAIMRLLFISGTDSFVDHLCTTNYVVNHFTSKTIDNHLCRSSVSDKASRRFHHVPNVGVKDAPRGGPCGYRRPASLKPQSRQVRLDLRVQPTSLRRLLPPL